MPCARSSALVMGGCQGLDLKRAICTDFLSCGSSNRVGGSPLNHKTLRNGCCRAGLAFAANVPEFSWSLEKPSLAGLPLFVGGRRIAQTVQCLACHLSGLRRFPGTYAGLLRLRRVQRGDDRLAFV